MNKKQFSLYTSFYSFFTLAGSMSMAKKQFNISLIGSSLRIEEPKVNFIQNQ